MNSALRPHHENAHSRSYARRALWWVQKLRVASTQKAADATPVNYLQPSDANTAEGDPAIAPRSTEIDLRPPRRAKAAPALVGTRSRC